MGMSMEEAADRSKALYERVVSLKEHL